MTATVREFDHLILKIFDKNGWRKIKIFTDKVNVIRYTFSLASHKCLNNVRLLIRNIKKGVVSFFLFKWILVIIF